MPFSGVPFSGRRTVTASRWTISATFEPGSFRSPTRIAPVGHTVTHAGSRPTSSRCAQRLHFSAELSSGLMKIASYGQAAMQALQPMQTVLSKSTMPSSRRYIACVGHAGNARGIRALVTPGHLKCAPDLRKGPYFHRLDVGPGDAERHLVLTLARGGAGMTADALVLIQDLGPPLQDVIGCGHMLTLEAVRRSCVAMNSLWIPKQRL